MANNKKLKIRDSREGKKEAESRLRIKAWRDKLESYPRPFLRPEKLGLDPNYFQEIADSYTVTADFAGGKYRCLRREFPGEILVEQLGLISGRYFAPPHSASPPAFLKEHSMGEKEAANVLGLSQETLADLIESGEIDHFILDDRTRLWRSDIEGLKRDRIRLRELAEKEAGKRSGDVDRGRRLAKKKPPKRTDTGTVGQAELRLDKFQIEAAEALRKGHSVLVSAPTGNGKTLVAEMLAKDLMSAGQGMVYTSPLKALSNQKYRDFKDLFGKEAVGLVTGDISINPGAPMLIMTTEIFRNWCLSEPDQLVNISYVVFDEIHYLDDAERGTTWEESILFAPAHIKILGLSATVPNVEEMADWIGSVRGEKVVVIQENARRVPLEIRWILPNGRIVTEKEARVEIEDLAEYVKTLRSKKHWIEE